MVYQVPSVQELRAAFLHKPSTYKVSIIPTKEEIENLQDRVFANLRNIAVLIPKTSSATIDKEKTKTIAKTKSISIQELLYSQDPGPFVVPEKSTFQEIAQRKEEYAQDRFQFQYQTHLEQACLLDLLEAIPSAFLAKFSSNDHHQHPFDPSVTVLLQCLEDSYHAAPTQEDVTIPEEIEETLVGFDDDVVVEQESTLPEVCHHIIREADDKIEKNIEMLDLIVTVNTFFGGLLLFGLTGTNCDCPAYTRNARIIIEQQILDFCFFTGAIFAAFFFMVAPGFDSWTTYAPFRALPASAQTKYHQREVFQTHDPDHIRVVSKALEENRRRIQYNKLVKIVPWFSTVIAVGCLLYVVLQGAQVQLNDTSEVDGEGLGTWILATSVIAVIGPCLVANLVVKYFTGKSGFALA